MPTLFVLFVFCLHRSSDLGLGIPFNVASYSVFTSMLAHVCGLKPKEFVHVMADTHVYLNHVEALKEQILRTPTAFPTLKFKRQVSSIDDFQFEDFELIGYNPQKTVKMEMAV
jgi:thymidylate synthase